MLQSPESHVKNVWMNSVLNSESIKAIQSCGWIDEYMRPNTSNKRELEVSDTNVNRFTTVSK